MTPNPGGLLGLPPGVPNPLYDAGYWRDLLAFVAVAAGAAEVAGRRRTALAAGLVFGVLGTAFWVLALARPYGVLVDAATTRWAADVAVTGWAGGENGFLVGESPSAGRPWLALARRLSPSLILLLPTLLPAVFLTAGAVAIATLRGGRAASLAAILWVACGTGPLESARGLGLLPGVWPRPGPALLWLATAVAVLAVARLRAPHRAVAAIASVPILGWIALGPRPPVLPAGDVLLAITLDQLPWLLLAGVALHRERDPAVLALVAGGGALALARALGGPGDSWAGTAFVRLGAILGAASALAMAGEEIASRAVAARRWPRFFVGVTVVIALAGSWLAWWDPLRVDETARASAEPIPAALLEATAWLRAHTPPDAVVLADPEYAPAVAVLGGRRVLRAPGLLVAPDDERRLRLERALLGGRAADSLRQRYSLRYVFLAPGQFREYGLDNPDDIATRGNFRRVYANAKGMRVYEVGNGGSPAVAFK
ncbi:MAG: hypothetical protein DMF77_16755 [Acidobacteria bacterium]|nr:MAG: hypothetical protein DMF77_16755 [Acidobacteriota bacterium]